MQLPSVPIDAPSAWTGEAMRRTDAWIVPWSPADGAELKAAAQHVRPPRWAREIPNADAPNQILVIRQQSQLPSLANSTNAAMLKKESNVR